jgi:D-ribose pyranase
MKKTGILNAKLMEALTDARHKDTIVILDAGMPVPEGCNYIDLGLIKGIPSFMQALKAVLGEIVIEKYDVFDLMPQYNSDMFENVKRLLNRIPGGVITQRDMMEIMKSSKAVIRTAEFGSCCNIVLYSASGLDKYVERFNIEPNMTEKNE